MNAAQKKRKYPQEMKRLATAAISVLPKSVVKDLELEEAIVMFQESGSDEDYALVCSRYDPFRYRSRWYASYGHLFETDEDFDGQMTECFIKALNRYKRGHRLNPFYYGILRTTFANIIKHKSASMRNPEVRCPRCNKLVAPLGSHVLQAHPEIVIDALAEMGIDFYKIEKCPLCREGKAVLFRDDNDKIAHFRSRHSTIIFKRFLKLYPDHHTAIKNPAPAITTLLSSVDNIEDDALRGIEDLDLYPIFGDAHRGGSDITWPIIDLLSDPRLSQCQRAMIETILYEDEDNIPASDRLCKLCQECRGECPRGKDFKLTRKTYATEMDGLKSILTDYISDDIGS